MKLVPSELATINMGPSLRRLRGSHNPLGRNIGVGGRAGRTASIGSGGVDAAVAVAVGPSSKGARMKDGTVQQKHETHHQHQDDEISSSSGTFSTTTTTTTTTPSSSIDEDDTNMMASLRDAILDVCDDDTKDLRCESRHNKTHVITNKGSFSSSASTSSGESLSSSSSEMMMMMQQLFSQTHQGSSAVDASAASSTTGPDESQWRKHGLKHRLKLLDEDRLKGGHDFKIAPQDCSVHRYFQVAHFALEQFHKQYQAGTSLEEVYVMGHRIVSFLTDCLPQHPGLYRAPDVQKRARSELGLLQQCLEDIALQIDEDVCNQFVADFNPALDDDDSDDDSSNSESGELEEAETVASSISGKFHAQSATPKTTSTRRKKRVHFEDWPDPDDSSRSVRDLSTSIRRSSIAIDCNTDRCFPAELSSPSAETVGTTGTGSFEAFHSSFDEDNFAPHDEIDEIMMTRVALSSFDEEDGHGSNDHGLADDDNISSFQSRQLHAVKLDFLERIAEEEVEYETDSDAEDSWAQKDDDGDEYPNTAPSSSGVAPTCDPARIAFRNIMNRMPKEFKSGGQRMMRDVFSTQNRLQLDTTQEEQVENEIRRYLDSDSYHDASDAFEALRERLKEGSAASSSSESIAASDSSGSKASSKNGSWPSSSFASSCTSIASSADNTVSTYQSGVTSASSLSDSTRSAFHVHPFAGSMNRNAPRAELTFEQQVQEENEFWERDDWIRFDTTPTNFFSASEK